MGAGASKTGQALLEVLPGIKDEFHVVMLGLDTAGKTTVLYRLKFDQYINTVPTNGFNCEKIKSCGEKSRGLTFSVWDVGGLEKIRPLWKSYTRCTDAIIFVVDSTDRERFEEAKMELFRIMKSPEKSGVPLLVLANKQDLPGAESLEEIEQKLGLNDISTQNNILCHIESTCAVTGEGLNEGLDALYELIVKRKKLSKRCRNKTS